MHVSSCNGNRHAWVSFRRRYSRKEGADAHTVPRKDPWHWQIPNGVLLQDERTRIVRCSAQTAGVPEPLVLSWSTVSENDWKDPMKAAFAPVEVTEKLWIVPQPDPSGLSRCEPTAGPPSPCMRFCRRSWIL